MDVVFTVNAGSSSLKCAAYRLPDLTPVYRCLASAIGDAGCRFDAGPSAPELAGPIEPPTQAGALARAVEGLAVVAPDARIVACSHRVVHGGPDLKDPVLLDEAMLERLNRLSALAPLHQPYNLSGVGAMKEQAPAAIQVACFDTAFHRGHPRVAEVYALPIAITDSGVRRYGFHGLSYAYISEALKTVDPELREGGVIVAHLGSGASLCAMRRGQSVDSTMGFTALDGLPMSTRTGQLDPGVVIHLLRQGKSLDEVERMFYRESGLKGLSGGESDMRALAASSAPEAAFAIEYFCHRTAREIGALAVSLDGLDGIVFTAGVGENQPGVRADIAGRLASLGVAIDPEKNQRGEPRFDAPSSRVKLLRIPTDEEAMLARHAAEFIQ